MFSQWKAHETDFCDQLPTDGGNEIKVGMIIFDINIIILCLPIILLSFLEILIEEIVNIPAVTVTTQKLN